MHCPKCGQQQISDETRYCSRCGLLLTAVAAIVANDGIIPGTQSSPKIGKNKRNQGLKQAAFITILGIVLVPIWIAFLVASNGPPELAVAAVFFFLGSAILRAAYAFLFQSTDSIGMPIEKPVFDAPNDQRALPPQTTLPADVYATPAVGMWKDTTDLAVSRSVTDSTTQLLEKEMQKPAG